MSNKKWDDMSQEEKNEIFKKLNSTVKVKLETGYIFEFKPFLQCASMPPQYSLTWLPHNKTEFMFCDQVFNMIATQSIETNNIEYLNECKFNTKHIQLNLNL